MSPKKQKTFLDAAELSPEEVRGNFCRAWKQARCADLYDGNIMHYFQVIAIRFEEVSEDRARLKMHLERQVVEINEVMRKLSR